MSAALSSLSLSSISSILYPTYEFRYDCQDD